MTAVSSAHAARFDVPVALGYLLGAVNLMGEGAGFDAAVHDVVFLRDKPKV